MQRHVRRAYRDRELVAAATTGALSAYTASDGVLLKQFSGSPRTTTSATRWQSTATPRAEPGNGRMKAGQSLPARRRRRTTALERPPTARRRTALRRRERLDTIFVGAYGDDDDGTNSGSVYVFRTTDGGLTTRWHDAQGLGPKAGADFGNALAADAAAVIGAYSDNSYKRASTCKSVLLDRRRPGGPRRGPARRRTTSSARRWMSPATPLSSQRHGRRLGYPLEARRRRDVARGDHASDDFGQSVAIDGDTIVIGASGGDATAPARAREGVAAPHIRRGGEVTAPESLSPENYGGWAAAARRVAVSGGGP